jgi:hypothetical protein
MVTTSLIAVVGLICAAALAVGFGFVVPGSNVVGSFFDVLAGVRPSAPRALSQFPV